ncbi:MAG: hypothetical protein IKU05_05450 [Bacteroidales bacterium]|nr:hypothetical protein [Bacteroidales bacterium]MBR6438049.1 hypothetical protein [Bacteroidales bacterium]
MALNKAILQKAIADAFAEQRNLKSDPESAATKLADAIATAIDDYIKSGDVSVTTQVTGTCATPSGAGSIAGTGVCTNGKMS